MKTTLSPRESPDLPLGRLPQGSHAECWRKGQDPSGRGSAQWCPDWPRATVHLEDMTPISQTCPRAVSALYQCLAPPGLPGAQRGLGAAEGAGAWSPAGPGSRPLFQASSSSPVRLVGSPARLPVLLHQNFLRPRVWLCAETQLRTRPCRPGLALCLVCGHQTCAQETRRRAGRARPRSGRPF